MPHRDDREATRARADAAVRDLADARREVERLAPETDRLARENEALRSKLALLSPLEAVPVGELATRPRSPRTNLVLMSIALGALTAILMLGLLIAALMTRGMVATSPSDVGAPTSVEAAAEE